MDRARWKKIEAIVDVAMELQQPARTRFIVDSCKDDAELLEQVTTLIYNIRKAERENFLSR